MDYIKIQEYLAFWKLNMKKWRSQDFCTVLYMGEYKVKKRIIGLLVAIIYYLIFFYLLCELIYFIIYFPDKPALKRKRSDQAEDSERVGFSAMLIIIC